MNGSSNNGTVEAYKSIIEFNKTVISISSTVLAALIAYLVYQNIEFRLLNYLPVALLVPSIAASIFGFGGAISTIKDSQSRPYAILFTNIGAWLLLGGIFFILFIKENEKTIDSILNKIKNTSDILEYKLEPANCIKIEYSINKYFISYLYDSTNVDVIYSIELDRITSLKKYTKNEPIKSNYVINQRVRLNNVFFDFNKWNIKPESYSELTRISDTLFKYPSLKIEINAHTDNIGSDSFNLMLSNRRAESVVQYLLSKGVARSQLSSQGYGESSPIATNETNDGRALNRRVEFIVLKN